MTVPVISPDPGTRIPDAQRGAWAPAASTAAEMSDQLIMLASQAQHWHHALLRTSAGVLALTEDRARAACAPGTGTDAVRARLRGLLDGARTATWLHASDTGPGQADRSNDPVADLLLRRSSGVRVLIGRRLARRLASSWPESAAEIRVAGGNPPPATSAADLILTDRQAAMTVWRSGDGQLQAGTVAEPAVVGILRMVSEALWAHSVPLESAVRLDGLVRDEAKAAILELLEAGAKDEAIARTLGVSLRTCRRHIAELLAAAGAVSRFQAGSRLARACVYGARPS
ncbi:MAG TPA: helix-turn-helix domain-containing protein [Streptosporangiaceae bacterium]|nr:helix-turn-helix domain-containing protein [Streptosporangiaceae bacterium]